MKELRTYRKISTLVAVLVALGMVSCQVPESERTPEVLEMSPSSANPSALQSAVSVTVRCDLHWTAELLDSSWGSVKVTQVTEGSGGTFSFEMGVNTSEESRENTLIVKAGKGEIRKTIIQGGLGTCFNPRSLQLSGTKEASVSFPSPSAWTAEVAEGVDWLEVKTPSGAEGQAKLTVAAKDANENVGSRTGAVRITVGGNRFDIPVVQAQTDVILTADASLSIPFEAREITVGTQYNVDYSVESSVSWITHVASKAPLNKGAESFIIQENTSPVARTGEICFYGGKAEVLAVTISQGGKDPVLNTTQPGFYGIGNANFVWGSNGWSQCSCLVTVDGSLRYRLLNGHTLSVVELTGMRQDAVLGQSLELQLTLTNKGTTQLTQSSIVEVLYEKDGLVWLKESDDTYFVVNK